MKKLGLTMMVALMATVGVCAQKVRRPDTYNYNRGMELLDNGDWMRDWSTWKRNSPTTLRTAMHTAGWRLCMWKRNSMVML